MLRVRAEPVTTQRIAPSLTRPTKSNPRGRQVHRRSPPPAATAVVASSSRLVIDRPFSRGIALASTLMVRQSQRDNKPDAWLRTVYSHAHDWRRIMMVKIMPHDKGAPNGKLADAEVHFTDGAFEGLKLL